MGIMLTNVLPLEELEAGFSLFSILLAFFIVMIIVDIGLLIYTISKKKVESKKYYIIFELIFLAILIGATIGLNGAIKDIVKDIVVNYPNAGYFLK